ncbi:MAG: Uma2 family endonuclease [Caldilineaceae bacterium SB0662_bin_9]|uniref:Uma2 family endonuclease n=1 Tax=Caldilineaceae bacterium SB0662_bin_9 TaxID=2605258 RepID=A0A6B1DQH4_9CHLR|nr:Uma2 family endonuclease [Caldilineaceae bacterium SB0662_bin_9]
MTTGPTSPWFPKVPEGKDGASTWWAYIKDLPHYDPAYPYDPRHAYEPDGTDDDAYGKDGIHFPAGRARQTSILAAEKEARRLLGRDRVFRDRCLKLSDLGLPRTNRYARCGQIVPDLFIQERPRPDEDEHEVAYDPDNPILFVLQVLFQSTVQYDLGPKVELYWAMGVREFWRYDPDRLHRAEEEPRLWGLRLSAEREYEDIEPIRHEDGQPVYRSDTLGEFRMLDEGESYHTLQTWEVARGVWLDPERALKLEIAARTRMEYLLSQLKQQVGRGALETHVTDTLAAAWRKANWVPDATDAVDVLLGTKDWSSLLPPGDSRT